MNNKFLILISTLAIICALVACSDNLFGSGSSGSGSDIKSLRIDAENAFRNGKYDDAYDICSKIVKLDSTVSFGYYGMAQAVLWKRKIHNPADIFGYIDVPDNEIPFMGISAKIQNDYLQGMKEVARVYSLLNRRDSLTQLYELYKSKSFDARLDTFKLDFCSNSQSGDCVEETKDENGKISNESFPLSDREYKGNYFGGVLIIATTAKSLLNVIDLNKNGCIARRGEAGIDNPGDTIAINKKAWDDWGCESRTFDLSINLTRDSAGNLEFDLNQILEELGLGDDFYQSRIDNKDEPLPSDISDLNDKIDNFTGDLEDVIDMMDAFGFGGSDEDDSSWKDDIEKYKAYAGFYKAGTRIDEDGDGCIEEDLLDGQDNDGDGTKNTNARVASTDPNSSLWGKAGINHSMYGEVENSANINHSRNYPILLDAPVYIKNKKNATCPSDDCTELWGDEETEKVTVIGFTQEEGYWTSNNLDDKLAVAQDTVCGQLKYSLQDRIDLIGGCWPNYDNEKFLKYWLRRGLASTEEQARRTHQNCKTCTSTADCLRTIGK